MALDINCHIEYVDKKEHKEYLQTIHNLKIKQLIYDISMTIISINHLTFEYTKTQRHEN